MLPFGGNYILAHSPRGGRISEYNAYQNLPLPRTRAATAPNPGWQAEWKGGMSEAFRYLTQ